ncbi:MAG: hypothetical protein ABW219_09940 [Ilumatobacteraceae bacterium]
MPEHPNQSEIDRLYWETDVHVADAATALGLPARSMHQYVTPLPAGVRCYRCSTDLSFTSRTQRDGQRLRCGRCGCSRRNPNPKHQPRHRDGASDLALVGQSVIVVREGGRELGMAIEACIEALATGGEAWDGSSLIVVPEHDRRPEAVVRALGSFDPGVVAVHALTDLAATQTERLQVLFTLTRMRWRVVAASDVHIAEPVTERRLDGLADETDEDGWVTGYDGYARRVGPQPLSQRLINATAERWGMGWR